MRITYRIGVKAVNEIEMPAGATVATLLAALGLTHNVFQGQGSTLLNKESTLHEEVIYRLIPASDNG